MCKIETTDNNLGDQFISIVDENGAGAGIDDATYRILLPYAGVRLSEIVDDNPGLLVFPPRAGEHEDGIEEECLYSLPGGKLTTHNVAGVFGIGKGSDRVQISIRSRFDKDNPRQYFLMAMLKKVLGLNLLDLPATSGNASIWDLLPCLLPYYLKRALSQGVFRSYRLFGFNDSDVRGTIDVGRQIDQNVPFKWSIAYETREHTDNNDLVHLVRHAIEVVARDSIFRNVMNGDEDTRKAVARIRSVTPDYARGSRSRILARNSREVRHPYYTHWTDLQRLCVRILRHDTISFNGDGEGLYGIVFDVAWLWEEYLACCFQEFGLNFIHARNKTGVNGIAMFKGGRKDAYPDFYSKDMECVLDAKYKHLQNHTPGREDVYQMISYIHVLPARRAILLYPLNEAECSVGNQIVWEAKELCGREAADWICKLGFVVPKMTRVDIPFGRFIGKLEDSFRESLQKVKEVVGHNDVIV